MATLDFNFNPIRRRPVWVWGILGLGMALMVLTTISTYRNAQTKQLHTQQLVRLHQQRTLADRPVVTKPADSKAQQAADTIRHTLAQDWEPLFQSIEQARYKGVDLLAVRPDMASHTVFISGMARSLPDADNYLRRLQQTGLLQQIHLRVTDSSTNVSDPAASQVAGAHDIQFELSATWQAR
ncbi:hypothetical protein [Chitinivorax sp. B]|uniref:hypothetical protein n=1 Tax=Chitinivorax sp. B TaxID=2502235 RepID=UPI0010F834A6|nr:hypothetical protein [Chitinivorax sp. B]